MEKEIKIVKSKLWKFGYSVKDYNALRGRLGNLIADGFDLIVEGSIKVKVGTKPGALNTTNWPEGCDVYAEVKADDITFYKLEDPKTITSSKSPYAIFGRKIKK